MEAWGHGGVQGNWKDLIGHRMQCFTLEPFGVAEDLNQLLF